jgi:sulfur carrier protein
MQVTVNGQPRQVPDGISLDQVVATITTSPTGIAVAVNSEVVRRASWPDLTLGPGDEVEVLTAVQGG